MPRSQWKHVKVGPGGVVDVNLDKEQSFEFSEKVDLADIVSAVGPEKLRKLDLYRQGRLSGESAHGN